MKKASISSIIFALIGLSVFSQDLNIAKLDSLFDALQGNDRFMGSIALSHKNQNIYVKALGFEDIESRKQATTDTKYRVGSITKMFTSSLIFIALEDGKLTLDQTIDAYFPNIENAAKITIGNLLNHRSGIHNFTSREDYQEWDTEPRTKDELIKIIEDGGSVFEPNSKAEYSNSNYVLLTFILEETFKKSYPMLVKEKITTPLGLKNTYVGRKIDVDKNEANSYAFSESWEKKSETDMSIPLGAGAIVSNPLDLNLFVEGLFDGKLISKESLDRMKTISDGYGMGIFQVPFYDRKGYGHNGGIDGFTSVLGYFPEDKLSVALISNGNRYANNDIIIATLSAFHGKPFDIPSFKTIELKTEDLDKYLGVYASTQIPLKITITKEGNALFGQATGQPSFPMEAVETDIFEFAQAGVRLEFNPDEKEMVLKQGGGNFEYKME